MKYLLLIPSGIADHAYESLDGKTPLEIARTPHLDALAEAGMVGMARTVPDHLPLAPEIGAFFIFGYDPARYYTGGAPLEAAGLGIELGAEDTAFRANLITEADGEIVDFTAGHISSAEAEVLVRYLNEKLGDEAMRFYPGVGYRNIAVFKSRGAKRELTANCYAPHVILGKAMDNCWPHGPGNEWLKKIMIDSKRLLSAHEINQVRLDLGENPANMVWFWGQGAKPELQSFSQQAGMRAALASPSVLMKGFAKSAGIEALEVPGMTGYIDTNYEGKIKAALGALERNDLAAVHVEAASEAGMEGNLKAKIQAIEDFDRLVAARAREYMEKNPQTRIMVMPDISVDCENRSYIRAAVPFLLCGAGVKRDEINGFSELQAQASDFKIDNSNELMPFFTGKN